MAEFLNPNNPQQPCSGVYVWRAENDKVRIVLYVGCAGARPSIDVKGTLFRGICELQRNTFCSDTTYSKLDTDFIVGTALKFFGSRGFRCTWEHICDDPKKETALTKELKPILQNTRSHLEASLGCCSSPESWRLSRESSLDKKRLLYQRAEIEVEKAIMQLCSKKGVQL